MPDENKLQALADAGFIIQRTCYRCVNFQVAHPMQQRWGTCALISYDHLKHSGPPRQASVPPDGSCPRHEFGPYAEADLGAHSRFIEPESK